MEPGVALVQELEHDGATVPTWRPQFVGASTKKVHGHIAVDDGAVQDILEERAGKMAGDIDQRPSCGCARNPIDDGQVNRWESIGGGSRGVERSPARADDHDLRFRWWARQAVQRQRALPARNAVDGERSGHGSRSPVGLGTHRDAVDTRSRLLPLPDSQSPSNRCARVAGPERLRQREDTVLVSGVITQAGDAVIGSHTPTTTK